MSESDFCEEADADDAGLDEGAPAASEPCSDTDSLKDNDEASDHEDDEGRPDEEEAPPSPDSAAANEPPRKPPEAGVPALTGDRLTKFEIAKILGERACQISHGAPVLVETDATDALAIAEQELACGRLAFVVRRPLGGGLSENRSVRELRF